jgi:tetratricopeptide (TPR) repeat protein
MTVSKLLQKAIQAAREGRDMNARALFQDVIHMDPQNELAWLWLSGLYEDLDDRLHAIERVLAINPGNERARAYYLQMRRQRETTPPIHVPESTDSLERVRDLAAAGELELALERLEALLRRTTDHRSAWELMARLSPDIDDQVRAYEVLAQKNPTDSQVVGKLKQLKYFQSNPLELAAFYEENGQLDQALEIYRAQAAQTENSSEFDRIYRKIEGLEHARFEGIRYVQPGFQMLRLSLGIPLFYAALVLIQLGMNPLRNEATGFWLGFPAVVLGSLILALAAVPAQQQSWRRIFGGGTGKGDRAARLAASLIGWTIILLPHLFLVTEAIQRLQEFEIPPFPGII